MTETANAQQIEYWNGPIGERWANRFRDIDRGLARITAASLAFAGAQPSENVLDIGCGAGTSALELARAVGPQGQVTGIDISAPMLAAARARAANEGLSITFIEADASTHRFSPDYDLLYSRFGVMFFADPIGAFANLRTALKPHGRLRFVTFRPFLENIWAYAPYKAAEHILPPPQQSDPSAPGPFAFADPARVRDILAGAGFRDIGIEKLDTTMNTGPTLEHAAKEALMVGPLAAAARNLDDAARGRILTIVEARMKEFITADGVTPPAACWLVAARV